LVRFSFWTPFSFFFRSGLFSQDHPPPLFPLVSVDGAGIPPFPLRIFLKTLISPNCGPSQSLRSPLRLLSLTPPWKITLFQIFLLEHSFIPTYSNYISVRALSHFPPFPLFFFSRSWSFPPCGASSPPPPPAIRRLMFVSRSYGFFTLLPPSSFLRFTLSSCTKPSKYPRLIRSCGPHLFGSPSFLPPC